MQFVRRVVPNDHECLFTAVALQAEGSFRNAAAQRLRAVCAETVLADGGSMFTEAILGRPPTEYAEWIRSPFNWGGEVELAILAKHFGVRIDVVGMQGGYVVEYDIPEGASEKIHLLYTGQHYDALVGVASPGADTAQDMRRFPVADASSRSLALACAAAEQKAAELRASQRVKKVLKCNGCGALCNDSAAFQAHCMEVEHGDDFDYMCEEVEVIEDASAPLAQGQVDLTDEAQFHTFYNSIAAPFSNFFPAAIKVDSETFPTVEHFWQSQRYPDDTELRSKILASGSITEVHHLVSSIDRPEREDWDKVKSDVLLKALQAKFAQHAEIADQLLSTGEKTIVNVDSDDWGGMKVASGISSGQNNVGLLLMQVRSELRAKQASQPMG